LIESGSHISSGAGSGYGSRSRVLITKNFKKYSRKKIFFGSKTATYFRYPSTSIKDVQATGKNIHHFNKLNLLTFFFFVGSYVFSEFMVFHENIAKLSPFSLLSSENGGF
jgi:hypothetical protein